MTNRAVVITISDRCAAGVREDRSGPAIIEQLEELEAALIHRETIPDELQRIRETVGRWIDRCELIITTGGTGLAARDVTPEAIGPLIQRPLPGFGEAMRMHFFATQPLSILSRSGAGVAGRTLIVWLPGSPGAVRECLEALAPAIRHACGYLRGQPPH